MPDALGLLESAQSTASKIPYENIAAGQKSIGLALNAFHLAADTNLKKQQIEQQMAALQSNMFYKNQDHQLDMEKFGWQQKYQMAALNRQDASERSLAAYRDRMATTAEDRVALTLGINDANAQNASKYQDELQTLAQKYPDSYANQEFANEISLVNQKYNTVSGTKEGAKVWNQFQSQIKAAQNQGHWAADQIRKNFSASVAMQDQGGKGFGAADYARPDDAFTTKGDKMYITERPIMVPGTTSVAQWATVPKDDPVLGLPLDQQEAKGYRVRSVPVNTYKSTKALHDTMLKIGGTDLNQKPAAIEGGISNEVTRNVNGRPAVFDSNSKQFIRWANE